MEFIINHVLNMFSSFGNYCIASYILIIPSIILTWLLDIITSDDSIQIFDGKFGGDEVFGMIVLAPLGIVFTTMFIALLMIALVIQFVIKGLCKLEPVFDMVCDRFKRYKELFGCSQ